MPHRNVWQSMEQFIHGESRQALAHLDQHDELRRYEPGQNGRPQRAFAEDTVASSLEAPLDCNDAILTIELRMEEEMKSKAKDASQDLAKIQGSPSVNGDPQVADPTSDSPKFLCGSSPNFPFTALDVSALNIKTSGRSKSLPPTLNPPRGHGHREEPQGIISPPLINDHVPSNRDRNCRLAIPKKESSVWSISSTPVPSPSLGDSMTTFSSAMHNNIPLLESLAGMQDLSEPISDRQPQLESIKSPEGPRGGDQRQRRRLARLHGLHSRTLKTRAHAYEKRSQLRHLRSVINAADKDFIKLIKGGQTQGNENDSASREARFMELLSAREEYESLEKVYDELEEQLDREDYEISELEGRILEKDVPTAGDGDVNIDAASSVGDDDSETPEFFRHQYHPLYEEYMSRLGDADLRREAHDNLVIEFHNLLQKKEVRQRHGEELPPEDQAKLAAFPSKEAKILEELDQIEADVEHLRLQCIQEGLLFSGGEGEFGDDADSEGESEGGAEGESESESEIEGEGEGKSPGEGEGEDKGEGEGRGESESEGGGKGEGESEMIDKDPHILGRSNKIVDPGQIEYNKYPVLLPEPGELEGERRIQSLISEFDPDDTGDRITRWLLHKLRSSCSEVELLARYSKGLILTMDNKRWQEKVLQFWFVDSANLPPSAYLVEPTLIAPQPPSFTNSDNVASACIGEAHLVQLVIRSSSLSRNLELEFSLWLRLARMKSSSATTV